jgi:phenylalanyl-tRNA synthetase beta chain
MKFSEQWLRARVDPPVATRELAEQLTMAGLEVEAITPAAAAFTGVVVGRISDVQNHPSADRLKVCAVDTGSKSPLRIVTGAAVSAGIVTAVAPEGAVLAGNRITAAAFKGVNSQGVLCSAAELGLAEEGDTLLMLPRDAAPGTDLRRFLGLDDTVIEIAITPNRGDCLSIAGVAREVAAINAMAVPDMTIPPVPAAADDTVDVRLMAPEACPR